VRESLQAIATPVKMVHGYSMATVRVVVRPVNRAQTVGVLAAQNAVVGVELVLSAVSAKTVRV